MTVYVLLWTEGRTRKILFSGTDKRRFELLIWRNSSEITSIAKCTQVHASMTVETTILTVGGVK